MTRHQPGNERGVAAVITLSASVVLLGIVALALDMGRGYLLRTRVHQAVELAAEAGAGAYDRDALGDDGVARIDPAAAEARAMAVLDANLPPGADLENLAVTVLDDGQGGGGIDPGTGDTYASPTVIVHATASTRPLLMLSALMPSGDAITVDVRAAAGLKFRFEQ